MPQMMPINWIILFLFFICIFIIFNIMNYYIYKITPPKKDIDMIKTNYFYWKW
uniref:ATP synthase complex subunit 8 n=1 Tax=Scythris sinensis TaxID=1448917 RepID=A0A6G5Q942_9NEOP|nr:ATP synthase F0 subunit 8 [Scythris sinensis]QBY40009.1 ATP synthase F0 subunit 8 [Scythris sinensis]